MSLLPCSQGQNGFSKYINQPNHEGTGNVFFWQVLLLAPLETIQEEEDDDDEVSLERERHTNEVVIRVPAATAMAVKLYWKIVAHDDLV